MSATEPASTAPNMPAEKEKKRPRPLDLNRSNLTPGDGDKAMSEFAIKCVSPGLPPLSAKMRSTVLMSKTIEAQQRHIIAQRIAATTPGERENDKTGEENDDVSVTPSTSGLTNHMEDLSIPSSVTSNKRLKRDKVPSPLNLGLANGAPRPLIKSAPIYNVRPQHFTPSTARRATFRKGPPTAGPGLSSHRAPPGVQIRGRPMMTPLTPHDSTLLGRQVPTSAYPYPRPQTSTVAHFGRRAVPKTATTLRNPASYRTGPPITHQQMARYQQQLAYQQHQWAKFKQYQDTQKVSHVTDVFQGEGTRFAPLEAQPLSAQRNFFDLESGPIRPQVISAGKRNKKKDRITEESGDENVNDDDDGDDKDDPESAAIEEDAEVGTTLQFDGKVSGALKLGNNIFKFDLERYGSTDKERFLKHCAAAWDQFAKIP